MSFISFVHDRFERRPNVVAFATKEGLLPYSMYALTSNLGLNPTLKKRAEFTRLCEQRGFVGKVGQATTFRHEELEKVGFAQYIGRGNTFTVIGMGDERSTVESIERLGEYVVDAIAVAVTSGPLWSTTDFHVVYEHRTLMYVFDTHVTQNLRGVRPRAALFALIEGITRAVAKRKRESASPWHKDDTVPPLTFGFSGFRTWSAVDDFNNTIVPSIIAKHEKKVVAA